MTDAEARSEAPISDEPRLRPPVPRVTVVLIALNLAAFIVAASQGAGWVLPDADKLVELGGNLAVLTLGGEPWRLLTSTFLHAGLLHLALNMICLWAGGQSAELMYGRRSFLAIFVVAGLLGSTVSTARTAMVVSVGASGAVFGVFGAILAYLIAHRDQLEPTGRAKQLRSLGTFMVINLVLGVTATGIDLAAHVGGLAAGFGIGFLAERGLDLTRPAGAHALRIKRVIVGSVVALVVCGGVLVALPRPGVAYMTQAQAKVVAELDQRLTRFGVNEPELLGKLRDLATQAAEGTVSDEAMARVIDTELLPRWRAMRTDLAEVSGLPARVVVRQRAVVEYVTARIDHLEVLSSMLKLDREDAAAIAAARSDLAAKEQAITAALAVIKREFE